MKHDKDLLKIDKLPAFRAYLEAMGLPVRDGKGSFEVLQVKTFPAAINWAVINKNAAGVLTSHPDLRPLIQSFNAGVMINPKPAAPAAAPAADQFLEDLRDDMAMAALQGLLSNPNVLGKHPDGGRAIGPNTPAVAARDAYRFADAMLEARKVKPTEVPLPTKKSDSWHADWKANGYNHCMEQAAKALRHLADHDRPIGGESSFNSAHLFQIASELDVTRRELLAP